MAQDFFKLNVKVKNLNELLKLKQDFRKEIIEKGLDHTLSTSLNGLKQELTDLINKEERPADEEKTKAIESKEDTDQAVSIPKSEEEILKYITNDKLDIAKFNKTKDYSNMVDSKIVFAQASKYQDQAARVRLRLDIAPNETVESQFLKAKQFFSQAIIAIPDKLGRFSYFLNPGIDVTRDLKIVCSTDTGITAKTRKKFDLDSSRRGYSEWSLKQEAVNSIKNDFYGFINLNEVVAKIKDNDIDGAVDYLEQYNNNTEVKDLKEKVRNLKDPTKLATGIRNYLSVLNLIKYLKLEKTVTSDKITYRLVTLTSEPSSDEKQGYEDFFASLGMKVGIWITTNEKLWVTDFINKAKNLVEKYQR